MRRVYRLGVLTILLLSILVLIGCAAPQSDISQPPATRLRLTNNSDVAIERIVVIFPEERIEFGPIAPGQTTEYKPVEHGVYAYAAYELTFGGQMVQQPVIDWIGERGRTGDSFTYVLSIDPTRPAYSMIQSEVHQD